MALYVSAGRRRRNGIAAAVAALVVGVVVGFLVGRSTAPTVADSVADAREQGRKFATALRVLPLEYEQMAGGAEGGNDDVADLVARGLSREDAALAAAPWLTPASTAALTEYLEVIRSAPEDDLTPDEFAVAIETAAGEVDRLFGLRGDPPPSSR